MWVVILVGVLLILQVLRGVSETSKEVPFSDFLDRQMQAGGTKAMSFGKSKAKLLNENQNKVTFADVAGVDEAKDD
jgi:ATP-dependent Zn protease